MMDLDREPKDPKFMTAIFALLALICTAMGGAYAFTSGIARDYVSNREYDRGISSVEQHLNRMEEHLAYIDKFVHGKIP
jgi:hypothetical protein